LQVSSKTLEDQLRDDLYGAIDEVSAAHESSDRAVQRAAARIVDPLVARYNELLASAESQADRDRLERSLGRLLTDLRRRAGQLPQHMSGAKAKLAEDVGQPFLLNRAPSPYLKSQTTDGRAGRTVGVTVGKDVDAYCGKCQELRAHRVLVLQDGKPQKVECTHCKSQHNFRTEPGPRAVGPARPTSSSTPRAVDPEAAKKRQERERLIAELQGAADVRAFDPQATYRAGMIVDHPKYGRGRIETVTRGSVLIRFADGLRPMMRS